MTEEEARTKWCKDRAMISAVHGYDPEPSSPHNCCIASDCMMWRWESRYAYYQKDQVDPEQTILRYEGKDSDHGFCGLGGKP